MPVDSVSGLTHQRHYRREPLSPRCGARNFLEQVATARRWDGTPLPPGMTHRLPYVWAQLEFLTNQLAAVDAARATLPVEPATATGRWVGRLQTLRGIGSIGAWSLDRKSVVEGNREAHTRL